MDATGAAYYAFLAISWGSILVAYTFVARKRSQVMGRRVATTLTIYNFTFFVTLKTFLTRNAPEDFPTIWRLALSIFDFVTFPFSVRNQN